MVSRTDGKNLRLIAIKLKLILPSSNYPLTPKQETSLSSKILWSIVLKAAGYKYKSSSITDLMIVYLATRTSLFTLTRAVSSSRLFFF